MNKYICNSRQNFWERVKINPNRTRSENVDISLCVITDRNCLKPVSVSMS